MLERFDDVANDPPGLSNGYDRWHIHLSNQSNIHLTTMPTPMCKRVLLFGATGTIGRAAARALMRRGHEVVCFVRPAQARGKNAPEQAAGDVLSGASLRFGEATEPESLRYGAFAGEHFDAIVSCMASRSGASRDAWLVDYQAHVNVLDEAKIAGVKQFVLLSAICVQKPLLAFQHAKLAFEKKLVDSGLEYAIVRPTAYFKSLSGQLERLKRGKRFVMFGKGDLTACKPISDQDLGEYLADCVESPQTHSGVLPIGGPGDAITPKQQGEYLFKLLGVQPRFRHVPIAMMDFVIGILDFLGRWIPKLADKAEFARIGRYYATESMLVLNSETNRYDASATPSTGTTTLFQFYEIAVASDIKSDLGEHAVF